jgi:hypothetical protein
MCSSAANHIFPSIIVIELVSVREKERTITSVLEHPCVVGISERKMCNVLANK